MKNLILILFLLIVSTPQINAGTGAFPQGDQIRLLKDRIAFKTNTLIITGDADDPTVTAKEAPLGSWYVESDTGEIYVKQDAGLSTNWKPIVNSTASLTQGSIPFVNSSGSLTEDNANLFYDVGGTLLGVGTNTPDDTLDVVGTFDIGNSTSVSSILDEDTMSSDSATALVTQQSVKSYADANVTFTPNSVPYADAATGKLTEDNANLAWDDSTDTMTINEFLFNGNVITETTGFGWFESQSSGDPAIFALASSDAASTDDSAFRVYGRGKAGAATNSEYVSLQWETATDDYIIQTSATGTGTLHDLEVRAGANQDQIFLQTDGNVGINHASPDAQLDVNGTFDLGDSTQVSSILDEDSMVSDSATALATQQSIKAYADSVESNSVDSIGSSTDNAVARWDGTTGELIQDSGILLTDTSDLTGVSDIIYDGGADENTSILADTTVGNDTRGLLLKGGGGSGSSRGSTWAVYGSDNASNAGNILGQLGTATGSKFSLLDDSGTEILAVDNLSQMTDVVSLDVDTTLDLGRFTNCDDPTAETGRFFWCNDDNIPYFYDDNGDLAGIGRDITRRVKNVEGSVISRGDVVYITGSSGANPEVQLALASNVTLSTPLGVVLSSSIPNNGVGKISLFGRLQGVDTSSFTAGDVLYLSDSTPGALTATEPSIPIRIGVVTVSNATGGEISIDIDSPSGSGGPDKWAPSEPYLAEEVVWVEDDLSYKIYEAKADFTSGASFDASNWNELSKSKADEKEFLVDPGFEYGTSEWSCTNATVSRVTDSSKVAAGLGAAEITGTAADGYCELTYTFADAEENQSVITGAKVQTTSANVRVQPIKAGSLTLSEQEVNTSGEYDDYYSQTQSSGSTGFRVTLDNTEVAQVDLATISYGAFDRLNSKNCSSDLDCENTLTVNVANNGTTASGKAGENSPEVWWNSINLNSTGTVTIDYSGLGLSATPGYGASINQTNAQIQVSSISNTEITLITRDGSHNLLDSDFSLTLYKQGSDYTPTKEQGVVQTGGAPDFSLFVSDKSSTTSQTVGNSTVTVQFGDIATDSENLISWDTVNNEATFHASGKIEITSSLILSNNNSTAEWFVFPEVDDGSGYSLPAGVEKVSAFTGVTSSISSISSDPNANFKFRVNKGDKVRLRVTSTDASSVILGNSSNRYPTMQISSAVDIDTINAEIEERFDADQDSGSLNTTYASGGVEFPTGDTWINASGVSKEIYQRCYEVTSDITSNTTIDTIPSGLNPKYATAIDLGGGESYWFIEANSAGGTSTSFYRVYYNRANGNIEVALEAWTILSGYSFCMKYTK
jgi:hypothetical protein